VFYQLAFRATPANPQKTLLSFDHAPRRTRSDAAPAALDAASNIRFLSQLGPFGPLRQSRGSGEKTSGTNRLAGNIVMRTYLHGHYG
jgi:hypothetical protein